jgi:CubicO group peptidase (beta-lactamase class C family)
LLSWVQARIDQKRIPGAVVLLSRHGVVFAQKAFGVKEAGGTEPMTVDTLFDLTSVTKVSTAATALALVDAGKLGLDDSVSKYLPAFTGAGKDAVTVRDLLTHSSGLGEARFPPHADATAMWTAMMQAPLDRPPRTAVNYSDLGYRILGKVLEAAAGAPLDRAAHDTVWAPLGMTDTMYTPPAPLRPRVAATGVTPWSHRVMRGEVADYVDLSVGGVAGCDGLFSTARDLAVLGQMVIGGGTYGGKRILRPESAALMTTNQTPWADPLKADTDWGNVVTVAPKTIGWELMTPKASWGGTALSARAFGKCGITGAFLLLEPAVDLVAVYLTNEGAPKGDRDEDSNEWYASIAPNEFFTAAVGTLTP